MVVATIFVEGGATSAQKRELRRSFQILLQKVGVGDSVQVIPSGARSLAVRDYRRANAEPGTRFLLVDSEGPIAAAHQTGEAPADWLPWDHLANNADDRWPRPEGARNLDCHLMVEAMENWFLADPEALRRFYGARFKAPAATTNVETVSKAEALKRLAAATKSTSRGTYDKGSHAFELLATIDPAKLHAGSKWAARFFDTLAAPPPTHGV